MRKVLAEIIAGLLLLGALASPLVLKSVLWDFNNTVEEIIIPVDKIDSGAF